MKIRLNKSCLTSYSMIKMTLTCLSFLGTIFDNFCLSCSVDSFTFLCSELEVSPLLTQPLHSDVRLLELVLVVGLDGLDDGGESFAAATTAATASDSASARTLERTTWLPFAADTSRIGIHGIETALRGTTSLFWATGTLAQRRRCLPFGVVLPVSTG